MQWVENEPEIRIKLLLGTYMGTEGQHQSRVGRMGKKGCRDCTATETARCLGTGTFQAK